MLYYRTIDSKTLELLKKIQKKDLFSELRLVGGTSLALQIGHRTSIDLDLFGKISTDKLDIDNSLGKIGALKKIHSTDSINIYSLDGIKVDIVNYPYPWLDTPLNKDDLILASIKDIAAMKLAAISGRGSKKDFIDIFFLLKIYSLKQMIEFYNQKYHDGSSFLVLKSLSYFSDADDEPMPKMIKKIKWKSVKSSIKTAINEFINLEMQ